MTDRHCGYVIALEKNIREDDAEAIIAAVRMIKGVVGVKPVVACPEEAVAEMRVRNDMCERLLLLLRELG